MVVIVRGVEKGACISSGKTLDILQYTIDIQDKKIFLPWPVIFLLLCFLDLLQGSAKMQQLLLSFC